MTLTPAERRALYSRTRPNRHGGLVRRELTPIEILSIGGPRLLARLLGVKRGS